MEKSLRISYLALLLLIISLVPYIYLSFFTHPAADDYCYSVWSQEKPFWENFIHLFLAAGGRYTTNALLLVNPLAFHNFPLYQWIPVFQIIFSVFALYYLVRSLTSRSLSGADSLSTALLFLLVYLFQMPDLAQGIYNYTSAVDYHTGIIVTVLYFGLLHDYVNKHYLIHRSVHFILAILLLIIVIGFSEVITLILISFHFVVLIHLYKQGKKISKEWWILSMTCIIFSLIMLLAPGNSVRSGNYPGNHNLLLSLSFSFMQMVRFGFDWISSLPLLFLALLLGTSAVVLKEKSNFWKELTTFNPWVIAIGLLWILFACIFPAYWGTNILGQYRTVNIAFFFFAFYLCLFIPAYLQQYFENKRSNLLFSSSFRTTFFLAMIALMSTTRNGYNICTEILYNKINTFDAQMNEQVGILVNPENQGKDILLKPLSEKPKTLFVLELSPDSTYWVNYCEAKYFGVKSILCKE